MKQAEQRSHYQKLALTELQQEIQELEKKIQAQVFALAFGKSKITSELGSLKRQLARALTIANEKLILASAASEEK